MSQGATPNRSAFRSAVARRAASCVLACFAAVLPVPALETASAADAAEDSVVAGMPLTAPVKGTLAALQEDWLQWDSAFLRGDQTAAEVAVNDLLHTGSDLGMVRLPDLCVSMLARAYEAAATGNTAKAGWAVTMAERLEPGSPEIPMTAAAIARYERRYLEMLWHQLRGYVRVFTAPPTARLLRENLLVCGLAAILLTGALFIALQLASYGAWLIEDLAEMASRLLPVATAYFVALVLVILPILVPSAWIVFPFYWAILLAPYALKRERVVMAALLAAVFVVPFLMGAQAKRVAVELSDGMRAAQSLREGRLYGGLFKDIDTLRRQQPNDVAVLHMTADLHTNLGQMEYARLLYEDLLRREPTNFGAHNNLGAYYLGQRNVGKAIEHFERATALAPDGHLEPHRNLYQLYRDYLAFEEAEAVLVQVHSLAPDELVDWVRADSRSAVLMNDGYERLSEIALASEFQRAGSSPEPGSVGLPRGLAPQAFFLVVAMGLSLRLLVKAPGRRPVAAMGERLGRIRRWVPGLRSLMDGRGEFAYLELLVPVTILLLPRMSHLGYALPWGVDRGVAVLWLSALVLLLGYFGLRWLWRRRVRDVD